MKQLAFGPYRILSTLGEGGMGTVYLAEHEETNLTVALKTVRIPHKGILQGIRREINALARIRHPGIVRIIEHGVHEGLPWYAMDVVEGVTLHGWAGIASRSVMTGEATPLESLSVHDVDSAPAQPKGATATENGWWTESLLTCDDFQTGSDGSSLHGTISPTSRDCAENRDIQSEPGLIPAIVTLVRRLCLALSFMHGEGIIHRDLKPQNILVTSQDLPIIVDFGLATQFGGEASREILHAERGGVGTLRYMAPEQIQGEMVDARADLYSLGCILYELLSGSPPFTDSSVGALIQAHLKNGPVPLSHIIPGIDPRLDQLVSHLMEKQPMHRLGYADDVIRVLDDLGAEKSYPLELPQSRTYLYRPGFIGRENQTALFKDLLTQTTRGSGSCILIGGESGVGKTRLAIEVARGALRAEFLVLTGECFSKGGSLLQSLRKPLQHIADHCREAGRDETKRVLGAGGKVLSMYEPELHDLPGLDDYPDPAVLPPRDARMRLYKALSDTVEALSTESPILLVLDDLQWADDLTVGWLEFLERSRRLKTLPVLIYGTYRSEERSDRLRDLLRHEEIQHFILNRFDQRLVTMMVKDMLAFRSQPSVFGDFLHEQSEGNPFFVAEYLRLAVEEKLLIRNETGIWQVFAENNGAAQSAFQSLPLPRSLYELVKRRLIGLSVNARKIVQLAAVVGREIQFALLIQVNEVSEADLLDVYDELKRKEVMELEEDALRFVHDKIRETIYGELSDEQRRRLHRLVAEGVESLHSAKPREFSEMLAYHWERAGIDDKAIHYNQVAGDKALYEISCEQALFHYERALSIISPDKRETMISLMIKKGEALHRVGHRREAHQIFQNSLDLAEKYDNHTLIMQCKKSLGYALYNAGSYDDALILLSEALEYYEKDDNQFELSSIMVNIGNIKLYRGQYDNALTRYQNAREEAEKFNNKKSLFNIINGIGNVYFEQHDYENAILYYNQLLQMALESNNKVHIGHAYNNLGSVYGNMSHFEKALQFFSMRMQISQEMGDCSAEIKGNFNLGVMYRVTGQFSQAITCLNKSLDLSREAGDRSLYNHSLKHIGDVYYESGDFDQAKKFYFDAIDHERTMDTDFHVTEFLGAMAMLCFDMKRDEEAQAYFEEAREKAERLNRHEILSELILLEIKMAYRKARSAEQKNQQVQKIKNLIEETTDDDERASLSYDLYHMSPTPEHLRTAFRLFQALVEKQATYINKTKLQILQDRIRSGS